MPLTGNEPRRKRFTATGNAHHERAARRIDIFCSELLVGREKDFLLFQKPVLDPVHTRDVHVAHRNVLYCGTLAEHPVLFHGDRAQIFESETFACIQRVIHDVFELQPRVTAQHDRRLRDLFGKQRFNVVFRNEIADHTLAFLLRGKIEFYEDRKPSELFVNRFVRYENERCAAIGGKPYDADRLFD